MSKPTITSLPLSSSSTVSWIHIGDTHLTRAGEQNEIDLGLIVDEINAVYAKGGIDFVFVPGDIADDGSVAAYETFRKHLDRLQLPWFGIVGDHDVHEKSFANFQRYITPDLYGSFTIDPYRFLRLNTFAVPRPDSFVVDEEQLQWLESELEQCERSGQSAVVLMHCYPSDLKQGRNQLTDLLRRYPVLLVDMGHTHYNELSNDGKVLYSATRSTGQIEEGRVGYSVTTLDQNCVAWHFVELGSPSLLVITHPADERLTTERTDVTQHPGVLTVRAKVWSPSPVCEVYASLARKSTKLETEDGLLWHGEFDTATLPNGTHDLRVVAGNQPGEELSDSIRIVVGDAGTQRHFHAIDQENALGEWKERGLLGTQLGPNKNGKKW